MRPQKVENSKLLTGMMSVLRSKGYDGASLNELASASGLQKASLYHRFPGGKKEIVAAVLTYVAQAVQENIYNVLSNTSFSPIDRLELVLKNINDFYNEGEETCILRAMALDSGMELFGLEITSSIEKWVDGFSLLGKELRNTEEEATRKAYRTLILVQGSLVVAKAIGSNDLFKEALSEIKNMYSE